MNDKNVELVRKGYAAFANGDLDSVRELLSPDIVWHVPGENMLAGDYKGHDEVFGFFGKLIQETGGTFKLEVRDILANDERAVIVAYNSAERNGKRLEGDVVHVMNIDSEGKTTEFWGYTLDSKALDEFWS